MDARQTRIVDRQVVMAHEIGAVDRLRTLLRPTPPARARQYGPAAATAGAALDGLRLPATMILLLAAGPARAVFTTGTTDLDAFAAATADRYATLGKALFSLCAYDAVRENLRRHGAPAVGITTDFRFVLALLGHPARLRSVAAIRRRGLVPAVVALAGAEDVTFLPLAFPP